MKRGMVGGAYRGPVGVGRQRRTIRTMQVILVLAAVGLLLFAGYSLGHRAGFDEGRSADELDQPRETPVAQVVVLTVLGLGALGAALGLQTEGGVRLMTPARLREMEEAGGEPIALADDGADEEPSERVPT